MKMDIAPVAALILMVGGTSWLAGTEHGRSVERDEIETAWDDITVVADGTLIANPAAYAWDPDKLARSEKVKIVSNRRAALDAAWSE